MMCEGLIAVDTSVCHGKPCIKGTRILVNSILSQQDIAPWATAQNRIIVTFNHDFGDIRDFPVGSNPGVIRLRIEPQTLEVVHPVLETLFSNVEHEKLKGALTIVTRNKVRVRRVL
jgi:predicted nuclease of predicted toxin-antitoxin system